MWLAEVLAGGAALPDRRAMEADIARERAELRARYVPSKRHTMQVDFDEYLEDVHAEIARGRRRAARA